MVEVGTHMPVQKPTGWATMTPNYRDQLDARAIALADAIEIVKRAAPAGTEQWSPYRAGALTSVPALQRLQRAVEKARDAQPATEVVNDDREAEVARLRRVLKSARTAMEIANKHGFSDWSDFIADIDAALTTETTP